MVWSRAVKISATDARRRISAPWEAFGYNSLKNGSASTIRPAAQGRMIRVEIRKE